MKSTTKYLTFQVPVRMDFVHITPEIEERLRKIDGVLALRNLGKPVT